MKVASTWRPRGPGRSLRLWISSAVVAEAQLVLRGRRPDLALVVPDDVLDELQCSGTGTVEPAACFGRRHEGQPCPRSRHVRGDRMARTLFAVGWNRSKVTFRPWPWRSTSGSVNVSVAPSAGMPQIFIVESSDADAITCSQGVKVQIQHGRLVARDERRAGLVLARHLYVSRRAHAPHAALRATAKKVVFALMYGWGPSRSRGGSPCRSGRSRGGSRTRGGTSTRSDEGRHGRLATARPRALASWIILCALRCGGAAQPRSLGLSWWISARAPLEAAPCSCAAAATRGFARSAR